MTQTEKITHMKSEGWEVGKMLGYQEEDAGAILTNLNEHYCAGGFYRHLYTSYTNPGGIPQGARRRYFVVNP